MESPTSIRKNSALHLAAEDKSPPGPPKTKHLNYHTPLRLRRHFQIIITFEFCSDRCETSKLRFMATTMLTRTYSYASSPSLPILSFYAYTYFYDLRQPIFQSHVLYVYTYVCLVESAILARERLPLLTKSQPTYTGCVGRTWHFPRERE